MTDRAHSLTRLALVVASAIALALAFPKFDLSLMAWVAFIPLLYAVEGLPLKAIFGYAWLQGLVFYLVSLYWVVITLHNFAGMAAPLAAGPLLLLAGVLALDTGAAFVTGALVTRRLRVPLFVTLPIAWTAFEWVRTYFPIGFPWNLLGYAAYRNLELVQFSSLTGVYGVSALIMFFNAVVYAVLSAGHPRRREIFGLSALTAMMVAAVVFGALRLSQLAHRPAAGSLRVAMVQGNIPQSVKWDPKELPRSFAIYADQTELAAREHAQLIIWPEAAAAFIFQPDDRYPAALAQDARYRERVLELARRTGEPILFGAPALGLDYSRIAPYNRAYLVSGRGQVIDYYDKMRLVPFGEYVPFRPLLGDVVGKIVAGFGEFEPGRRRTVFEVDGARLTVLICYESVFPDLTRRAVAAGAGLLVNITNDAWYGDSSAPYQLLAMAAMRAVETGAPMVRVANTGISAVITPAGTITARTGLFIRDTEVETVAWSGSRTVYTAVGDLFAELCAVASALGLLLGWLYPRRPKPLAEFAAGLTSANGHR